MCIRAGENELDSVKALMAMSLNALIAEVFDKDPDELDCQLSLSRDLAMDAAKQQELNELITDYFDGLTVDFSTVDTLEELLNAVVEVEF